MRLLDNLTKLHRLDPGGMLGRVQKLPAQVKEGWEMGLHWHVHHPKLAAAKQIVVLGMGGSAIGADLVQGFLGQSQARSIYVNRTYELPVWVGKDSLVLVCSYSGNTEETLSGAAIAKKAGASLAVITSGGRLADWAASGSLPILRIPTGLPPRSAAGYLAFAPLGMLAKLGIAGQPAGRLEHEVEQSCARLQDFMEERLGPEVKFGSNPAKQLAAWMKGRLPILYGASGGWEGVTYRWRTQIEENSKSLAFHHLFPEATHNEVSGWVQPKGLMKKMAAIFLTDPAVHPRTLRRMEFSQRVVRSQKAQVRVVSVPGRTRMERMLKLIALGDMASVYLGILYGIDPTPVERVEALKKFMVKG